MISHDITWYHVPRPQPKPPQHKLRYHDISCHIMNHDTSWYMTWYTNTKTQIWAQDIDDMEMIFDGYGDDLRWYGNGLAASWQPGFFAASFSKAWDIDGRGNMIHLTSIHLMAGLWEAPGWHLRSCCLRQEDPAWGGILRDPLQGESIRPRMWVQGQPKDWHLRSHPCSHALLGQGREPRRAEAACLLQFTAHDPSPDDEDEEGCKVDERQRRDKNTPLSVYKEVPKEVDSSDDEEDVSFIPPLKWWEMSLRD